MSEEEGRQALLLIRNQTQNIIDSGSTEGVLWDGRPVVLLTMRGAKTGEVRQTPVMRVEHEGNYAVVGSKGGHPREPLWCANLRAYPDIELLDGTVTKKCTAREVQGEERELWWQHATRAFPAYDMYKSIAGRIIPVFVLDTSS